MNWDDVRVFLAVSREGSVSRAGQSLGVNHTTVARRVAALEAKLAARLFDRSRDGYALTQAGENMVPMALAMEASAQAIDRQVFGRDAVLSGPLKLTVPYDLANRIVVPALGAFATRYPQIDLELLTTTGRLDLQAREADLALRLTASPPDYLVGRQIVPLRHGVYVHPERWRDFEASPRVILFRSERAFPEWVEAHFPDAAVALRVDNLTTMLAAVEAGLGLARMPCFEADSSSVLRRLDFELTPSTWGVWVLSHADLRSTARVRVAREYFADAIIAAAPLILGERSAYL